MKPPTCEWCSDPVAEEGERGEDEDGNSFIKYVALEKLANSHGKLYHMDCLEEAKEEADTSDSYAYTPRPHTYHEEGEVVSEVWPDLLSDAFSIPKQG